MNGLTYCDGFFPFCVKQNGEYWDGISITPFYDWNTSIEIPEFYAPKASEEGKTVVGPNTAYPLGLSLERAVELFWRIKNITLIAPDSVSVTSAAITTNSDFWVDLPSPGIDHWGSHAHTANGLSYDILTLTEDTVLTPSAIINDESKLICTNSFSHNYSLPDWDQNDLPAAYSQSIGDGEDQCYAGNILSIYGGIISVALQTVPVFHDNLFWFPLSLKGYLISSAAVRQDSKNKNGPTSSDYSAIYNSMHRSYFSSLGSTAPINGINSNSPVTVLSKYIVPFVFGDGFSVDCEFLSWQGESSGPWTHSEQKGESPLIFPRPEFKPPDEIKASKYYSYGGIYDEDTGERV